MRPVLGKNRRSRITGRSALLFLSILIIILGGYIVREPLSGLLHRGLAPLYTLGSRMSGAVTNSFDLFSSKEYLLEENRKLSAALEESRLVALDRNLLYEENLALKERFDRLGDPNAILGTVILKPPFSPYDTLLIDVGTENGVSVGDKVAAVGTVLIGVVRDVYPKSARVVLYSTPGESAEGFLEGADSPVTLEGLGGGGMRARIPYGIAVATGTVITIPSISANTAGLVEHVTFKEGDAYSEAYIRLPVNPFSLTHVDVWRANTR